MKICCSTWKTDLVSRLNVVVRYKTFMSTLHCALENGADLHVNKRQTIRHYCARSTEERRRKKKNNANRNFFTSRSTYVKLRYIAMLYIHSFDWKSAVGHVGGV